MRAMAKRVERARRVVGRYMVGLGWLDGMFLKLRCRSNFGMVGFRNVVVGHGRSSAKEKMVQRQRGEESAHDTRVLASEYVIARGQGRVVSSSSG